MEKLEPFCTDNENVKFIVLYTFYNSSGEEYILAYTEKNKDDELVKALYNVKTSKKFGEKQGSMTEFGKGFRLQWMSSSFSKSPSSLIFRVQNATSRRALVFGSKPAVSTSTTTG